MKSIAGNRRVVGGLSRCYGGPSKARATRLYAQVMDAARKAQTLHITHYVQLSGKTEPVKAFESWYESGVGFRRDRWDCDHATAANARSVSATRMTPGHWLKTGRNGHAFRSRGITQETEQIFADIDRHARDLQNKAQRYPEGDQTFDGRPCKAYVLTKSDRSDSSLKTDKLRQLFYLDQQSRLVRVVSQEREGDRWKTTQFNTIGYDEPLGSAFFQPNFGKDLKIVDADANPAQSEPAKPEGAVLTYEVDPRSKHAGTTTVDMDKLLRVVDVRLNGGAERLAVVRKLDDRRIEVR